LYGASVASPAKPLPRRSPRQRARPVTCRLTAITVGKNFSGREARRGRDESLRLQAQRLLCDLATQVAIEGAPAPFPSAIGVEARPALSGRVTNSSCGSRDADQEREASHARAGPRLSRHPCEHSPAQVFYVQMTTNSSNTTKDQRHPSVTAWSIPQVIAPGATARLMTRTDEEADPVGLTMNRIASASYASMAPDGRATGRQSGSRWSRPEVDKWKTGNRSAPWLSTLAARRRSCLRIHAPIGAHAGSRFPRQDVPQVLSR
jgi:hypothetical protein